MALFKGIVEGNLDKIKNETIDPDKIYSIEDSTNNSATGEQLCNAINDTRLAAFYNVGDVYFSTSDYNHIQANHIYKYNGIDWDDLTPQGLSELVDLKSNQEITGIKTLNDLKFNQLNYSTPILEFPVELNINSILKDRLLDGSGNFVECMFIGGNSGLFYIITLDDYGMPVDLYNFTNQTPATGNTIYKIHRCGFNSKIYITSRAGIFSIDTNLFTLNNPIWDALDTTYTGTIYAVQEYNGFIKNSSYSNYILFGSGKTVKPYNVDNNTWGETINLGVERYAEFFYPIFVNDKLKFAFFDFSQSGYFDPETWEIIRVEAFNTDRVTSYSYYEGPDGLLWVQDSNSTIGKYNMATLTKVGSEEFGATGYIYDMVSIAGRYLILAGSFNKLVKKDLWYNEWEVIDLLNSTQGSYVEGAFGVNNDIYYITRKVIAPLPTKIGVSIFDLIPEETKSVSKIYELVNSDWVATNFDPIGDYYVYNLDISELGKTNTNHAIVSLPEGNLPANTENIRKANIFNIYDQGTSIQLEAKNIDLADGGFLIIQVEVHD